jgi:hypothetical protein
VVENVHAEVRTRDAFDGAGRSDDDAVEKRQRRGRLDAIGAFRGESSMATAFGGGEVRARLAARRCSDGSKSCGFNIAPCPKQLGRNALSAPQLRVLIRVAFLSCSLLVPKWPISLHPSR